MNSSPSTAEEWQPRLVQFLGKIPAWRDPHFAHWVEVSGRIRNDNKEHQEQWRKPSRFLGRRRKDGSRL